MTTSGSWLVAEMRRAAEDYKEVPGWARPVVTVPYADGNREQRRPAGFTAEKQDDKR